MDRPALQRLLADIAAGRVETIVVYKIDRLTRSLADFEILDAKGASFLPDDADLEDSAEIAQISRLIPPPLDAFTGLLDPSERRG
jgi:hypothetical protein